MTTTVPALTHRPTNQFRPTDSFPRYCPSCGAARLEQLVEQAHFVPPDFVLLDFVPLGFDLPAEKILGVPDQPISSRSAIGDKWEPVESCASCNFDFGSIGDPASLLRKQLSRMSLFDLAIVVKVVYPLFKNLISVVAEKMGKSMGHVQRVVEGERISTQIDYGLATELKARLEVSGASSII